MRFMREDEALKTIHLFEGASESKGISKRALKNWVVNAFRERRALALSLNDTKTAVNTLHHMLNVLVGMVIVVIWLLILKVTTTHFLIFLSSQLLLVVFMFGNTCKTTFEAIIFLFVMHPFDVGDRVEVEGVQMIVEEMNILTTVFLRYDNQKIIYPNAVLSTKPISNYYRSPDMGDAIDFCIHISTPMEKIAMMKERITRYIENKSEHWYPAPMIVLRDVEDMNRLKISLWLSHTMNHQDMGERWARRALLIEEMIKVFTELDIQYRMLPFDVNVRQMPALTSNRLPSTWAVNAFRERRALALSLNDTKTAVNTLHHMLNVLVGMVIVVIWLLILKVTTTHFLIFLSSQLLLVVFMFGNTCKTTFEAIIFLFVMHPFDVGDRVEVEGVQMIVEEMNILTTVFLRYDNQKIIYPNAVLSTKPISNYYRSPDMGDAIDFCIHISTPMEKIAMMKERITRYIENKSEHWYPAPMIVLRDVEDMNRLKISLWLSHTMNHQDMGERWARRALLIEEMIKVFTELDIQYRMLPFDVNVRQMPALTSNRLPSTWAVNAFRERRALALSLNDTKTAVNTLHHMLNVLVGMVIVVIWLLILKVTTTHFLIFLSSQLLLVVFMFGNTCKTTFEAIIFLFVMHPFDVGDRVEVEGVQMIVEEMNILTTVFLRYDNQKIIYPNAVLSTKPISNYYRSPDMGDAIDFCIHISTPMEKIAMMKERITRYIENKSEHWYPAPMIVLRDVEDMNRLKISLWLSHTMNHQDMGERWARRALLIEEMIKVFTELDIQYRMLPFDVNVRQMPALTSNRLPSTWAVCAS
ncbi:unnamed protein product [Ilex paraguariensis]|uniref:Mechanosensitive ion channel MscS domain-containing protein n=1 Tax=Ilex paraguariensis TaxID=185542 RepID=A0ABC8UH55_9AQUA